MSKRIGLASSFAAGLLLGGCAATQPNIDPAHAGNVQLKTALAQGVSEPTFDLNGHDVSASVRAGFIEAFDQELKGAGIRVVPNGVPVTVTVQEYSARSNLARAMLGMLSGSDHIKAKVTIGDASFDVEDTARTAYNGIGAVAENVGIEAANGVAKLAGQRGRYERATAAELAAHQPWESAPREATVDPITGDFARVIYKSSGMPMAVAFSTGSSGQACEAFQPVGTVADSGRGVLLAGVARLEEALNKSVAKVDPYLSREVAGGVVLRVRGRVGEDHVSRYAPYSCGPIAGSFTPEKGRTYVVDFDMNGTQTCSEHVTDITDVDHPAHVDVEPDECTRTAQARTDKTPNPLELLHKKALEAAKQEEASAQTPAQKAEALNTEASALDSLGRSQEALTVIDQALTLAQPSLNNKLLATKAGILFALDRPQAALDVLAPQLEQARKRAQGQSDSQRAATLGEFNEAFIDATFAHLQLEQWREAISTLADSQAPAEGASFDAYKGLLYRYIMARAQDRSLADARLERLASEAADHDKGRYGALLRMWRGEDAAKEIAASVVAMTGADEEDAFAEALFYRAAYVKFVKGSPDGARALLGSLNRLAPYGSIEWVYGRRVLQ